MRTILFVAFFGISWSAFAQYDTYTISRGFWSYFSGQLNGQEISISIYADTSDIVHGEYVILKEGTSVPLIGRISGDSLLLRAKLNGNYGHFKGEFKTTTTDFYQGTWVPTSSLEPQSRPQKIDFNFSYSASSWGTPERRYPELFGTDETVENFARNMKEAIIQGNSEWLSNHINYPIEVSISKEKIITIQTRDEFHKNFNLIFNERFISLLKYYRTVHLSMASDGVYFGRGEIYLVQLDGSTKDSFNYALKSIHGYSF